MSRIGQMIGEMMGRGRVRAPRVLAKRRPFVFEPLDQRLLLSATPFYSAAGAQAAVQLTVQLADVNGVKTLQVVDSVKGVVASTSNLAGRGALAIVGSGFDDTLTLASDLSVLNGRVSFDGGGGRDTLAGPMQDTNWSITGADAGNVRGLKFSDVGTLRGAANNQDNFIFGASGTLSGRVDGGAGGFDSVTLSGGSFASTAFNSIDPSSGSIVRDADVLNYVGMEPITDLNVVASRTFNGVAGQANNISLSYDAGAGLMVFASNTSETVNFAAPTATLTLNGRGTTDSITVNGLAPAFGAVLQINGNSTVASTVTFAGATASTNRIEAGSATDIRVNANLSSASSIQLTASRSITVANNVAVQAGSASALNLSVSNFQDLVWNRNVAGFKDATVGIGIDIGTGASLTARDVTLLANAGSTKYASFVTDTLAIANAVRTTTATLKGAPALTFANNGAAPSTLTRGAGSWRADGFQPGQSIIISGASANNNGDYQIQSLSADGRVLTIEPVSAGNKGSFNNATAAAGNTVAIRADEVLPEDVPLLSLRRDVLMQPDGAGSLPLLTFRDNVVAADTIQRSSGNWLTEGFTAGQRIYVKGSLANDGVYRIGSISADGRTITLSSNGGQLLNEAPLDGAGGLVTVQGINESVGSIVARDLQNSVNPGNLDLLASINPALGSIDVGLVLGFVNSASATIQVNGSINAGNAASIGATAYAGATLTSPGGPAMPRATYLDPTLRYSQIGATYLANEATATARLGSTAVVNAGNSFSLKSDAYNEAAATTTLVAGTRTPQTAGAVAPVGSQVAGAAIAVTYEKARTTAIASLDAGARVNAAKAIDVNASTYAALDASTGSQTIAPQKNMGQGVGLTWIDAASAATARVDGTASVISNGTGTGVSITATALNARNDASTQVSTTGKPNASKIDAKLTQRQASQSNSYTPGVLGISAGIVLVDSHVDATAAIGNGATVRSDSNVNVRATLTDNFKATAVGGSNAGAELSIGGAVVIADYDDHADASIGDNASVDAKLNLTVAAQATIPDQVTAGQNFVNAAAATQNDLAKTLADLQNIPKPALDPASPTQTARGSQVTAQNYFSRLKDDATLLKDDLTAFMNAAVPYYNQTSILPNQVATGYALATAAPKDGQSGGTPTANFAVTGTVQLMGISSSATAHIGKGARINQAAALRGANQEVAVTANGSIEVVNISGISTLRSLFQGQNVAGKLSLAGSYIGLTEKQTAKAWIDDGANVFASRLGVTANTRSLVVDMVQSGGQAKDIAISGAVIYNDLSNTALAYLENQANVNVTGDANIAAKNDLTVAAVTGTVNKAGTAGIGLSASVNKVADTALAFIGNDNGSAGAGGTAQIGGDLAINAGNSEQLIALAIAGTSSDAPTNAGNDTQAAPGIGQKGQSGSSSLANARKSGGIGLSGAVSLNLSDQVTGAFVDGIAALQVGRDLSIKALGETPVALALSGPIAIDPSGGSGSVGIAGAFNENNLRRSTYAYDQADTNVARNASVSATTRDTVIPIGASAAGQKKGTAAIAGAVNLQLIDSGARAWMNPSGATKRATIGGNLDVAASTDLRIVSVAGGFSLSGKFGLGAGVDVSIINPSVEAWVGNSVATPNGSITITGDNKTQLVSIAASLGLATEQSGLGLAGSASSQNVTPSVLAYVAPNANVATQGSLLVSAADAVNAVVVAGSAGAGGSVGLGASVANVNIGDTANSNPRRVQAYIGTGATVDAKGQGASVGDAAGLARGNGVVVVAGAKDNLVLVGAGGAGSKSLAFAASATVETVLSDVRAVVQPGARINLDPTGAAASQSLIVRADNQTEIVGVAGAIAFAGSQAAVGAAADVQVLDRTVRASIESEATRVTQVGAVDEVVVDAGNASRLTSVAIGIGASGNIALAGSASVVTSKSDTQAYLGAAANVVAGSNIVVGANRDSRLLGIGGAGAVGLDSIGFAATTATAVETDVTKAYIGVGAFVLAQAAGGFSGVRNAQGNLVPVKGVAVSATSSEMIQGYAVGGAVGSDAAISGSVPVVVLDTETLAFIDRGAKVNQGGVPANAAQDVNVLAGDSTTVMSIGGALAFGGAAVGAAVDVSILTKDTQAFIADAPNAASAAAVKAEGSVVVEAASAEAIYAGSGSVAAGGVSLGGSVGVFLIGKADTPQITRAEIGRNAVVFAKGNVGVLASDRSTVFDISGTAAYGGAAGIGASASVPVVNKQTHALIDNDAKVDALGNGDALAGRDGGFDISYVDFGNGDGYGGSNLPTITKVQPPKITGDALECSDALTGRRVARPTSVPIHGLVVSATNQDDIEIFAAGGSSAGVAVTLAGAVNVHSADTQARIGERAKINLEPGGADFQSVLVAAGNDFFHLGVGGAVAGGGTAGVSPAVDVTVLSNTAIARIGGSAQVKAVEDVSVVAHNREEVLSIAAGLSNGFLSVAPTVSLIDIDNHTLATIDTTAAGSTAPTTVTVGGNVDVRASDNTGSHIIAGAAALGGSVGFGVAVGVNDVHKDTRATIGDAVVVTAGAASDLRLGAVGQLDPVTGVKYDSIGGVAVQASSSEAMCTIVAAGSAGGAVGLAGAVGVSIIDSDTAASIGKRAVVSTPGDVAVGAYNRLHLDTDVGGVGLAATAGLAGGVDVGIVRSDTQSFIDDGATVSAGKSVNVNAFADRDVKSLAFSGAGGLTVGLAGAVSVYSIGSALDADANRSLTGGGKTLDGDLSTQANTKAFNDRLDSFASKSITTEQRNGLEGARAQTNTRDFASDFRQPVASGTRAFIGSRANVTSGDDINVRAKDNLSFDAVTGNGAIGGFAGIGGSVVVANIGLTDTAWVAPSAVLSVGPDLGDDITVEAALHDSRLNAEAYGGQGGALALGGQVTVLNDTSAQLAYIDHGVVVKRADHLNVVATAERPATLNAGGAQVGGLALGASVSRANLQGSTVAFIGHDPAVLRPATVRTVVNWLNITADNRSTASVDDFAATVGLGAGAGNDAKASVTPVVKAYLDGNNIARVNYTASITAHAADDADARSYGVSVGGVAAGVSLASAVASPDLQSFIGSGASITTGRDLIVQSVENYALTPDANGTLPAITGGNVPALQRQGTVAGGRHPDNDSASLRNYGAYATAFSSSGSLVGGDGATSTADDSAKLSTRVDGGAMIYAGGNVSVLSLALNDSHALASGVTFGLVAGGGNKTATSTATGSTRASLDGRVVRGANLDVQALATDTARAVTDATSASVGGAGLNSTSTTTVTPTLVARIGNESFQPFSGAVDAAASTIDLGFVHGYATGQRLVYDNGTPVFDSTFSLPTRGGGTLTSGATYYVIANPASPTKVQLAATLADAQAGKAIAFDGQRLQQLASLVPFGTRQSLTPPGANPYATVSGDVHLLSKSFNDGDASASGVAGSVGISAGLTYATSNVAPTLKTFIGQGGTVTAGGNVTVESQQGADIAVAGNTRFDPSTAINTGSNQITLTGHGLDSGASVTYSRNGGGDVGLVDQRSYHVIRVDANTIQLGDAFVAAGVNAAERSITFTGGHGFQTGDEVVYDNAGGPNTGGLLDNGHYFVKVVDADTVQLFATKAAALAAPVSFSATNVAASNSATPNRITLPDGQTLADGTLVTYRLLPADFSDGLVGIGGFNSDGTAIPKANVVYFGNDYLASHPLATGSRIKYQTSNQPLTGLVNGATYFVINNGDGTIGLSLTNGGPALAFSAAPADHTLGSIAFTSAAVSSDSIGGVITVPNLAALNLSNGQALVYRAVDGVAIGGLSNNGTYYVVLDPTLGNGFRLASSLSLAQSRVPLFLNGAVASAHSFTGSGPVGGLTNGGQYRVIANSDGTISLSLPTGAPVAIALNPANVFGLQSLTPTPIAVTNAGGGATQTLTIALKATTDSTAQALLPDTDGAQLGGGTDGIVSATASAAAYSVIGAGTGSEARVTLAASVATFVDMNSTVSGNNVKISSSSNAQTRAVDSNVSGSFIAATTPFARTTIANVNTAGVNSGAVVTARGDFALDATAAQGGTLAVSAEAGAGIAVAYANRSDQGMSISYIDLAQLGQASRVTAGGTATVATRAVTSASASATASGKGFGAGSRAAVALNVTGAERTEVDPLARLTAADVQIDSKVDATLRTNTDAYGGGFATEGYATSTLNASISPTVLVGADVVITGTSSVRVNASNNNVSLQNRAHTTTAGVFAFSIAETNGAITSKPTLTAPGTARVTTPSLVVTSAPTGAVNLAGINNAVRDVYAIDAGYTNPKTTANVTPVNNFGPAPKLLPAAPVRSAAMLQLDRLMAAAAESAQPAAAERVMVFDPELGIFVSRKPAGEATAAAEDLARYTY